MSVSLLWACSKEEMLQNPTKENVVRKSVPTSESQILTEVQEFLDHVEGWENQTYNPGKADDVDFEYAVWLMEAAINYENRGNGIGGEPLYVDLSRRTETTNQVIDYTMDGNSEAHTSEEEMFEFFTNTVRTYGSGKAPIGDLTVSLDGSTMLIDMLFFDRATEAVPDCGLEITSGMSRPAAKATSTTCHPTEDATVLLNKAITWGLDRQGLCQWAYYTWNHTVKKGVIMNLTGQLHGSKSFKLVEFKAVSGIQTWPIMGSNTNRASSLWEGTFVDNYTVGNANDPEVCLLGSALMSWETAAETLIDNEENSLDEILDVSIEPYKYTTAQSLELWYHRMVFLTGKPGNMPN